MPHPELTMILGEGSDQEFSDDENTPLDPGGNGVGYVNMLISFLPDFYV